MYIEEVNQDESKGDFYFSESFAVWDAKHVLIGAGARALFYPTLLYNVVRNKIQSEYRWWDKVDVFILLGAIPFPADVPRLKELNEPYEILIPSSLYHAHNIDNLVIPTRDYLFAPSLPDICLAVNFIHVDECFSILPCSIRCEWPLADHEWLLIATILGEKTQRRRVKPQLEVPSCGVSFNFEENAFLGKTTYVHCKAGRGHSTTIVLCYLVEHRQMTPDVAYEYVRHIRPRVLLAPSQWEAVQDYYHLKVKRSGSSDCVAVGKSPALPAEQDKEYFDDGCVVIVTDLDLYGYDASCDSGVWGNEVFGEVSLACRVQCASQAAISRLSCLLLGCHSDQKTSRNKLGSSVQLQNLGVDIRVC